MFAGSFIPETTHAMSILLTYQGQIWKKLKTTQFKSEPIKEKAKAKVPKFRLLECQWICKGALEPCNYIFLKKDIFTVKCTKSYYLPFITMNNHVFAISFLLFLLSQYLTCYKKINFRSWLFKCWQLQNCCNLEGRVY